MKSAITLGSSKLCGDGRCLANHDGDPAPPGDRRFNDLRAADKIEAAQTFSNGTSRLRSTIFEMSSARWRDCRRRSRKPCRIGGGPLISIYAALVMPSNAGFSVTRACQEAYHASTACPGRGDEGNMKTTPNSSTRPGAGGPSNRPRPRLPVLRPLNYHYTSSLSLAGAPTPFFHLPVL